MNIIIPDIDPIIVLLTELPSLVNLGCVSKYFYKLVSDQLIIKQWLIIKNIHGKKSIGQIFIEACMNGFLSYGMFLLKENIIDIHANGERAFQSSCENGHIQIAKWLIHLGESENYDKINIHADNEYAFGYSCTNGHIQTANWLIQLGESGEYKMIDIHANNEYAFRWSCRNGHIQIAKWLIHLGESREYKRINIHTYDEWAFRWSCINGYIQITNWLIQLGESEGYNKIDQQLINKYIKN